VKVSRHFSILLLGVASFLMGQALATEEPRVCCFGKDL